MTRCTALLLGLVCGSLVAAQEGRVWAPPPLALPPFGRTQQTLICAAGRQSEANVVGDGNSPIAIYVYDRLGRCVAFDDQPNRLIDDRHVDWIPIDSGPFDVQIRNVGYSVNQFEAAAQ